MIGFKSDRKNTKAYAEIGDIEGGTRRAIRQTWFALGRDLKAEANAEILRKPKSGKIYILRAKKSGRLRRHIASAPGETHANMRGKLRRSLSWVVHGTSSMEFGYGFSTTPRNAAPVYDQFVEFGTKNMKPRPSLKNAITAVEGRTENHFVKAMIKQFKRSE